MTITPFDPGDPRLRALIRTKARRLIGVAGLRPQDRADIIQELLAGLLDALRWYDPSKGPLAPFAQTVVERLVCLLLRHRQAQCRDDRATVGLEVFPEAVTLGQAQQDLRLGRVARTSEEQADLHGDVAAVLARLPAELQDLAQRLTTATVSEIARSTGQPRTTVSAWVRQLRQHFEDGDLEKYL